MKILEGRDLGHGRYQLLELVGQGGMGAVFRAQFSNPAFTRVVAIKILHLAYTNEPSVRERFRREARASQELGVGHPHILPVEDYGEDGDFCYLVMPFITGGTLRDRFLAEGGRPWTLERALAVVGPILDALDYAHERGVIHRDVKPSNILITRDRRDQNYAYLSDFGIAKVIGEGADLRTRTGMFIGTPEYVAPEQARGLPVDGRADLYAAGVVLYELLTGRVPYPRSADESATDAALRHGRDPLPSPASLNRALPEPVGAVLLQALAQQPVDRFASGSELRAALEAAFAGQPLERTGPSTVTIPLLDETVIEVDETGVGPAESTDDVANSTDAPAEPVAAQDSTPKDSATSLESGPPSDNSGGRRDRRVPLVAWIGGGAAALALVGAGALALFNSQNALIAAGAVPSPTLFAAVSPSVVVAATAPPAVSPTVPAVATSTAAATATAPAVSPTAPATGTAASGALPLLADRPIAGEKIVFVSGEPGSHNLHAMTPDGAERRQVTALAGDEENPSCSTDGRSIAFQSKQTGPWQLRRLRLDQPTEVASVTSGTNDDMLPTWSPSGDWIAFTGSRANKVYAYRVRVADGSLEQLTMSGADWRQSVAPDGRRIAFTSTRTGHNNLWLMNADGSEQQLLTTGEVDDRDPTWSPDGRWIAFTSSRGGHQWDLYLISPEGGQPTRLTEQFGEVKSPSWSPDGRWIIFSSNVSGEQQVYKIPVDGGEPVQLTFPPLSGAGPTWCR